MKPVLMIHEVTEDMFDLPLEDYILTFDDGLYSQYFYYPRFRALNTQKLYFISSNIVCTGPQGNSFPTCRVAHAKARDGNYEDYMTLEQIKELAKDPLVTIGCHGHDHIDLTTIPSLKDKVSTLTNDTRNMMAWFAFHIGVIPTSFCVPYNNDLDGLYKALLKRFGFMDFYGRERTPIETLLHKHTQPAVHGS